VNSNPGVVSGINFNQAIQEYPTLPSWVSYEASWAGVQLRHRCIEVVLSPSI